MPYFSRNFPAARVALTYNLMRTFVAALAFSLPFSLVYQMVKDRLGLFRIGWKRSLPAVTGAVAGISVSIAGNMHYVVYGQILPLIQKLTGEEDYRILVPGRNQIYRVQSGRGRQNHP